MPPGTDTASSWDKGFVYVPGTPEAVPPAKAASARPLPVVIYLHGCGGITDYNDIAWAKYIRDLGYIVVQPDSFARRDRSRVCENYRHYGDHTYHQLRLDEAVYAFEKLKDMAWADRKNIFLMGHSDGGVAAARSRIVGLRGVVVSSWTCTERKYPSYDGLFTPRETPVLTMGWTSDPWYGGQTEGSCENKFNGRLNARHIRIEGSGHTTAHVNSAREAVEIFLRGNRQ